MRGEISRKSCPLASVRLVATLRPAKKVTTENTYHRSHNTRGHKRIHNTTRKEEDGRERRASREKHDKDLASIDPDLLPPALKIGIAPAMIANPTGPYWGGGGDPGSNGIQTKMA